MSIIVVNRDGELHLRRSLPQLIETEYADFEVVVVDNGSTDGSLSYLEALAPPFPLRILRNSENLTFSEANNQGASAASGELLLFLNNDVEPIEPGWLGRMIETLFTREAAAVGARLIYPRRPHVDSGGDVRFPDLTLQHRGVYFVRGEGIPWPRNVGSGENPCSSHAQATGEVPAATTACLLVKREAFEKVGGFDEAYVYGTEDVDLCLKLRARGERVVYDGGAALWHHEFGTQKALGRETKRRNRTRNREIFISSWGPRIFREVLADRIPGTGAWSVDSLHVGITVTRDDPGASYGDWYTARELGEALATLGWRVSYPERYGDRWYALDESLDVLIVLLDAFDVHRVPPDIVTIAWVRNWTTRWLAKAGFEDYDIVLASSMRTKEIIEERTSKVAHLVPLATNPARFRPLEPSSELVADVIFTGNYWKSPRGIAEALPVLPESVTARVWGKGWERVRSFRRFRPQHLSYEQLPAAYSSSAIVVDDTGVHTKPYGAVNSRVFDALAAGAFVLTDNEEGVREVFDDQFPTWRDGESLRNQVETYLADGAARRAVVERYRTIVLDRHTYAHRAGTIRDLLLAWCEAERLGVHIGVPERKQVDHWGDYHYARSLARQLERRGRPTRLQLLPDWRQPHTAQADVVLHLFGLSRLEPRPGQINVLWVISHPELVTAEMCELYDLVLVASDQFAEELAGQVSVPVEALHQATDPERFHPVASGPPHELLFVANSRRVRRRIIDDLAGTPYDLAIYGREWTSDLVDLRHVRGKHLPNAELAFYYSSAAIVLNDHWPDMRDLGFFSNRLYDVLACGAFVISDHVEGIEKEFDGGVVTYRTSEELHELVDRYLNNPEERRRIAERGRRAVLERHTFGHRVTTILELVGPMLGARGLRVAPSRTPVGS